MEAAFRTAGERSISNYRNFSSGLRNMESSTASCAKVRLSLPARALFIHRIPQPTCRHPRVLLTSGGKSSQSIIPHSSTCGQTRQAGGIRTTMQLSEGSGSSEFDVDVAIAGGGPGGLVAALALINKGLSVKVFDKADPKRVGALLSLMPNGLQALHMINPELVTKCLEKAEEPQTRTVLASDGTVVVPPSPHPSSLIKEAKYGFRFVNIAWYELTDILRSFLPPGVYCPLHRCEGFTDEGERGVVVHLAGREVVRAGVLVGADGGRSTVRAQLLGDGPPEYSGIMSWRGVFASDPAVVAPRQLISISNGGPSGGPSLMFLALDIQARITAWVAFALGVQDEPPAGTKTGSEMDKLKGVFSGWSNEKFWQVLGATEADSVIPLALYERSPAAEWAGSGRVTLLGDSAHIMQPWLGQGTNSSIEDAHVLAEKLAAIAPAGQSGGGASLRDSGVVAAALRKYEQERAPRTATFQAWSSKAPLRPLSEAPPAQGPRVFGSPPEVEDWMYSYPVKGPAPQIPQREAT